MVQKYLDTLLISDKQEFESNQIHPMKANSQNESRMQKCREEG